MNHEFTIEVRVPAHLVERFADAITGHDDDIFLAAETAMRKRIDALGDIESIELWPDGHRIARELRQAAKWTRLP